MARSLFLEKYYERDRNRAIFRMHCSLDLKDLTICAVFTQLVITLVIVSGQNCSDTVGSLNYNMNSTNIAQGKTFIVADHQYTVYCDGNVIAWKFCYQLYGNNGSVISFSAGIWRSSGINRSGSTSYMQVNSSVISYFQNGSNGTTYCQRVDLSATDQFTAPAGSVVGLYSNVAPMFSSLKTTSSNTTVYTFDENRTEYNTSDGEVGNYNIAIELYLDTITTATLLPTTTVVPNRSNENHDATGIIIGCLFGFIICIILLILLALFLLRKSKQKKQGGQGRKHYNTTLKEYFELETSHRAEPTDQVALLGPDSNINYKSTQPTSVSFVQQNALVKDCPKLACNDYIALHNPPTYATALKSYEKSFTYDYARALEFSEVSTNVEEIYFDPGHSKADIYACFERKRFPIIKNKDVSILQKIGSGEFGTVHLGLWSSDAASDPVHVAVKTLNSQCSESDKVKFLREAAIMGQFEDSYIVKLHGVVTEVPDAMIVLELMPKGDLRECLFELKENYSKCPEEMIQLKHSLLSFCRNVSAGLNHLSYKGFVHRDLAARNILVSSDDVCKIADFGMARDVADDNYYIIKGGKIPIKWTPPEAIFYRRYSVQSDVWSYGCVMYEIWSLGHKPFEDDDGREYINKISAGYRLPPPPGCPRAIYELMIQCWHPIANQRISSSEIMRILRSDGILLPDSEHDEQSTVLGDPLKSSSQLYLDLQQTYLSDT